MNLIKRVLHFLNYKLFSKTAHSVHSPFVFDFVTNVLNDKNEYYAYDDLNCLRKKIQLDTTEIVVEDFGAGSRIFKSKSRKVSAIIKHGTSSQKFARLYFRIINKYKFSYGIELGTSIGLTTAYMAKANSGFHLYSIEACKGLLNYSKKIFKDLQLNNIVLVEGNFDDQLEKTLADLPTLDFFFVDGNHRYQSTLNYFEMALPKANDKSVFIFDDIRWSDEMYEAWKKIIQHNKVKVSIDLFSVGIVFFNSDVRQKQNYTLRF